MNGQQTIGALGDSDEDDPREPCFLLMGHSGYWLIFHCSLDSSPSNILVSTWNIKLIYFNYMASI